MPNSILFERFCSINDFLSIGGHHEQQLTTLSSLDTLIAKKGKYSFFLLGVGGIHTRKPLC